MPPRLICQKRLSPVKDMQHFQELKHSLVGAVLRPLVLGLMLFSSSHGVASSLLPLLSQLLESSDRVIQCCCRFGLLSSAHASYASCKARCEDRHSGNSNSYESELLWLLDLNQLVASLASKLSGTLLIADTDPTRKKENTFNIQYPMCTDLKCMRL